MNDEAGEPATGPVAPVGSGDPGDDEIPAAPLWAMTNRMHTRRRAEEGEEGYIFSRLGRGDETLYVIDDGADHAMVGRRVGRAPDGCVYCLVARIPLERYGDLVSGDLVLAEAFTGARDISLCGVFEGGPTASNVFVVQHYRRPRDVPPDYLPPSPFLEFTDDTDIDEPGDQDTDIEEPDDEEPDDEPGMEA